MLGRQIARVLVISVVLLFSVSIWFFLLRFKDYNIIATDLLRPKINELSSDCAKSISLNVLQPLPETKRPFIALFTWKPAGTLVSCLIPKAMTTIIQVLFGYLGHAKDCERYIKQGEKIVWYTSEHNRCLTGKKDFGLNGIPKDGEVFAIVREPISKFLSGWLDKCVSRLLKKTGHVPKCYGCNMDLECFIKQNYKALKELQEGEKPPGHEQDHYFPSVWLCPPSSFKKKSVNVTYIFYKKSPETYKTILDLLARHNLPASEMQDIEEYLATSKTGHATKSLKEYNSAVELLSEREDLYQMLISTYYEDYKQFSRFFKMYPTFKCWMANRDPLW